MADSSCSTTFHDPFHPPIRFVFKTADWIQNLLLPGLFDKFKFLRYDVDNDAVLASLAHVAGSRRCSSRGYKRSDSAFVSAK